MSGQNKKETRALLEVAISATLAHPNLVQTYSYEIVRQQAVEASGPAQRGSVDGLAGLASAPLLAEAILEEAERDTQLLDDGEEGGGGGEAQEARLIQVGARCLPETRQSIRMQVRQIETQIETALLVCLFLERNLTGIIKSYGYCESISASTKYIFNFTAHSRVTLTFIVWRKIAIQECGLTL